MATAAAQRSQLGVVLAAQLRGLRLALVSGFLHDRRGLWVGREALESIHVPIEDHPDPVALTGIAINGRSLGTVLLALLSTLGREDLGEAVEILNLGRQQNHFSLLRTRAPYEHPSRSRTRIGGCAPDCGDTGGAMSQENVERIKEGFEAHNRGDLDAMVELYDPEVVFETLLLGTHHGNEAIRLIYAENQK